MDDPLKTERWDEAPLERLAPIQSMPVLHLNGFDGPMDILLHLAERQMIDFKRMSIVDLAEQFNAIVLAFAEQVALERRAEWLVLATRLVVLRARLLLPASPEEKMEAAREAEQEIQRLDESARMRAAAQWLARRLYPGNDSLARPYPKMVHESGYVALMESCLVVLRGRPGSEGFKAPETHRFEVPNLWRISDALERMQKLLAAHPEGGPLIGFIPWIGKEEASRKLKIRVAFVSTFAACLELSRQQVVKAEQSAHFEEVTLHATQSGIN